MSPLGFWEFFCKTFAHVMPINTILCASALAWCEYVDYRHTCTNRPTDSVEEAPNCCITNLSKCSFPASRSLESLHCTKNPRRCKASADYEAEYRNRHGTESVQEQVERMLSTGCLSEANYRDVIRGGCPVLIPTAPGSVLEPECFLHRQVSKKTREGYLMAQLCWVQEQRGHLVLLYAKYHTRHRSDNAYLCPSMKVYRVVPAKLASGKIGAIQILLAGPDCRIAAVLEAWGLGDAIVRDVNDNLWMCYQRFEEFLNRGPSCQPGYHDAACALLAASHFAFCTRRMLE